MDSILRKAYAKVNLGLDVTGRRPDGYHLVRMVMQTVDLYDEITVTREDGAAAFGELSIRISCDSPEVPADSRNLAYKAAQMVGQEYRLGGRIRIDIHKRIPAAAGMAGGSSDAAAVLDAMDTLFGLSMDETAKDRFALRLGADVPFCLRRGTYLAEGIGEKLTRLPDLPPCHMVIVKPPFGVSTPWAYRALDAVMERFGDTAALHPSVNGLREALAKGSITGVSEYMGNILESAVLPEHPEIQEIKQQLEAHGALKALMSGSGPTVFGIFADADKAEDAFSNLGGGEEYGKFKVEFR